MTYEQFKHDVIRLTNQQDQGNLVPNNDTLYQLWEQKNTPEKIMKFIIMWNNHKKRANQC